MGVHFQVVTWRTRKHLLYEFVSEEKAELIGLLLSVAQLAACPGFYPDAGTTYYKASCWIFFVTSVVGSLISGHAALESRHFLVTHAGSLAEQSSQQQNEERGQVRRELTESVLYLLSGVTFSIGSILFLPSVYENVNEINDLTGGTSLFLAGSVLLAMAAYVNSLSVVVKGTLANNPLPTQLGVLSLFTTLAGAVAYCMGTLGYYPEFDASEGCTTQWSPLEVGTNLYVIGAVLFVVSGVLNLSIAFVKERQHRSEKGFAGRLSGLQPTAQLHSSTTTSKSGSAV